MFKEQYTGKVSIQNDSEDHRHLIIQTYLLKQWQKTNIFVYFVKWYVSKVWTEYSIQC